MLRPLLSLSASCALALLACSHAGTAPPAAAPLAGTFTFGTEAGTEESLDALLAKSRYSVFLFFTADCPVQKAHDARMRATVAKYAPQGVAFYAVASETGIDIAAERAEAKRRAIDMPLLEDKNAVFADALKVEYSTHVVLFEPSRAIRYSGAEDSERVHLTPSGTLHLDRALDAVLAGKEPPVTTAEPLGCPLRKH
ncbi:MAG: redoxin domain-containing protein [Labilithrix sp.]|nr:redoxin domain-containing protein [Labilithrix sp.]MCW5811167.1 redoxin domain-containing protein [Labilithrix sp.]